MHVPCTVTNIEFGCAVPPGDEGWLCPVCECKMECVEAINSYLNTTFEVENSWEVSARCRFRLLYGCGSCLVFSFCNPFIEDYFTTDVSFCQIGLPSEYITLGPWAKGSAVVSKLWLIMGQITFKCLNCFHFYTFLVSMSQKWRFCQCQS